MKKQRRDLTERRRTIWEKLFFAGMFTILFVWTALFLIMLAWAFMSSFKTNLEYVNSPITFPIVAQFKNYILAMEELTYNGVAFGGMLFNSLWQTIGPAFITTLMTCITGYIFAQYRFKGRDLIFNIIIFVMIIPLYGNFAANYRINFQLGLSNSYLWLIRSFGGLGGNMLLTYGFYKSIPTAFREAVYIDGGSDAKAFWKVYFPLGRNIFVALFLLSFIAGWNDYETPLLYMDRMPTLALGLYNFQQEIMYVANQPAYFAGAFIVMAPVLILFIFGSKQIMGKLYSGGMKG